MSAKSRYRAIYYTTTHTAELKPGIMILPVIALTGPGISVLAHMFGLKLNQIELLEARLAENDLWMCLCQELSTIPLELVFTYSTHRDTPDVFLNLFIEEPL